MQCCNRHRIPRIMRFQARGFCRVGDTTGRLAAHAFPCQIGAMIDRLPYSNGLSSCCSTCSRAPRKEEVLLHVHFGIQRLAALSYAAATSQNTLMAPLAVVSLSSSSR